MTSCQGDSLCASLSSSLTHSLTSPFTLTAALCINQRSPLLIYHSYVLEYTLLFIGLPFERNTSASRKT